MDHSLESGICILGAGPAGMAAALSLSKRNIACTLIEKGVFPRPKTCGDGISGKSLSILSRIDETLLEDLDACQEGAPSWGVKFVAPNGREVDIYFNQKSNEPAGYVLPRIHFDNILAGRVRKARNISFHEGVHIDIVRQEGNSIHLGSSASGYSQSFSLCLFASGKSMSAIKPFIDQPESVPLPGVGVRTYYEGVRGLGDQHLIEMHFLPELLPWYLWIFPLSGSTANVGLAMLHEHARVQEASLKVLLSDILSRKGRLGERFRDAQQASPVESGQLHYYTGKRKISGEGYLLLGDAASLTDPFTGEGIGNALHSGMIAADHAIDCIRKQDFSARATQAYDNIIYSKLKKELDLSLKMQKLGNNARILNLVIKKAASNQHVRGLLRDMIYDLDTKKKLTSPAFYIKLMLNF